MHDQARARLFDRLGDRYDVGDVQRTPIEGGDVLTGVGEVTDEIGPELPARPGDEHAHPITRSW